MKIKTEKNTRNFEFETTNLNLNDNYDVIWFTETMVEFEAQS